MSEHGLTADQINTSQPHPARMYDYYLGGRDNYEIDRIAANRIISVLPGIVDGARQNRAFMLRAVRTVVAEYGIRQLIDIGTGIPTSPNTHEVAQSVAPETRVVYIDNDPIVGVHANARLTGVGQTAFLLADARDPASFMTRLHNDGMIDFNRPVGLVLVALLHFLTDQDEPYEVVANLCNELPSGSFVVLSHATYDGVGPDAVDAMAEFTDVYKHSTAPVTFRTYDQVLGFFDGLELIEPGLTTTSRWRPEPGATPPPGLGIYAGVARKP